MLPPLVKRVTVPLDPDTAFSLFTDGIDGWWPHEVHGVFHADSALVACDGYAGGTITETATDGRTASWADIVVWEPPSRIVLAWHPWTDPEVATTVQVTFTPGDGGTEVELIHDGWEVLGAEADQRFALYDNGWDVVFGQHFAQAAGG